MCSWENDDRIYLRTNIISDVLSYTFLSYLDFHPCRLKVDLGEACPRGYDSGRILTRAG